MLEYINNLTGIEGNDQLVYKYLYFLSKSYAQRHRLFNTQLESEYFAIQCASELYDKILQGTFITFQESIKDISFTYKIITKNTKELDIDDNINDYSFVNHLIDLADSTNFKYFDLTEVDKFITQFLSKLPKHKKSAEFENIVHSILLTIKTNLKTIKSKFLIDYSFADLKIVLYHLDVNYTNYIRCLSQLILTYIKDSYNNILDSNKITPQLLHLNEILYEKN